MNPILKKCLLALPFAGLIMQAEAQTVSNINQTGTLVEMCASAQQEVEQDAANVQISYKAENRDKRIAADEVNKRMNAVIAQIKSDFPKVRIENQNYNTYQQYTPKGASKDWTVEQSFSLLSKNPKEVPSMVSLIQEAGVTVNGMNAYLTPEAAREAQEKLYNEAFDDVKLRLNAIAGAMGKNIAWDIVHVDTTGQRGCGGGGQYQPMMASRAMMKDAAVEVAPPTFEAGKQMVQLSVWVAAKFK